MYNDKISANMETENVKSDKKKISIESIKRKIKLFFKIVAICLSFYIISSIGETIIVAYWGDIYIEKVLEERYGEKFEYTGHAGLADYSLKCESLSEEIYLYINSSKYGFWNADEWEDDYLSFKYHEQAEAELLKFAVDAFGEGTKIEIIPDKNPGDIAKQCDSFDFYMENLLEHSVVKVLTINPDFENTENIKKFVLKLKEHNYYLFMFHVFWFDLVELDFNNYKYPSEIYSDSIHQDTIVLNEDFSVKKIY